jgi:hypothetical protein
LAKASLAAKVDYGQSSNGNKDIVPKDIETM